MASREPYISRFTQGTARHDDYYDDLLPSPPAGEGEGARSGDELAQSALGAGDVNSDVDPDIDVDVDPVAYAAARRGFLRAQAEQKAAAVAWATVLHEALAR